MTIAITLKVDDGIVLASDSATTFCIPLQDGGFAVSQIYNNAKKIFRLHKELPLGAITWGLACMARSSLKILAKDFRSELMNGKFDFDHNNYSVEQVAHLFKEFMFDRYYDKEFSHLTPNQRPTLGFMVAGYSSGQQRGEVWFMQVEQGTYYGPDLVIGRDESGLRWHGQPLPLRRLILGFDPEGLKKVLESEGLETIKVTSILEKCSREFAISILRDGMPIQDAIDLAIYLEETSAGFVRFCDGPASIGGPVEVATITKHEGFKWIKRKHYFDKKLNP